MKTRYKWMVADYHQPVATGLLEGKSVELLEGELIVRCRTAPAVRHRKAMAKPSRA